MPTQTVAEIGLIPHANSERLPIESSRLPTIRSRLVLLVITCVIPAALMATLLLLYSYDREHARLVRDSIGTARAMVQSIDRELSSLTLAADMLSMAPSLQSGDIPAFYAYAQQVVRMSDVNNAVLSDASGQQIINTIRPLGEKLPRHGNPEQVRKVIAL